MITVTTQNKIEATLKLYIKQGVDPKLYDMQNLTFNDVLLPDGTLVKDATFQQLQNIIWSYAAKNPTTLTDVQKP